MKKIFFFLFVMICALGYNRIMAEDKCADVDTALQVSNCQGLCCNIMPHVKNRLQNFKIDSTTLNYDVADIDNHGISCTLKTHGVKDPFPYEKSFKNTFYTIIERNLNIKANAGCGTDVCGTFKITGKTKEIKQALQKNAFKWYLEACRYCSGKYGENPRCKWH